MPANSEINKNIAENYPDPAVLAKPNRKSVLEQKNTAEIPTYLSNFILGG